MNRKRWLAAAVFAATLTLPALAEEVTVGDFVQRLATAKKIDASDPAAAVDGLRASGVRLPADLGLGDPLTEGRVAQIARSMGLDVSTNRPEAAFTATQVDRFFEAFRVEAALNGEAVAPVRTAGGEHLPFDPYQKGRGGSKGKKKGHGFTPSEPE